MDRLSWVALAAVNGVGTKTIIGITKCLTKHDIGWDEFWVLKPSVNKILALSEKMIHGIQIFKKEHTIFSYAEWLNRNNIRAIIKGEAEYPLLLHHCSHAPLILFAKGEVMSWDEQPIVAVVGTRHSTAYGELVTKKIATELTHLGAVIVSGFMYGIDVCAQKSTLAAQGRTVGILGYGFQYCYPSSQQQLFFEMLAQGATFYSPFAPHISPKKGQFVARNRVVAGMSHAVVVTEAAEKSGSHITAGYAADEGRLVCAVPGPITNPYSEGTRQLINQGAVLIQSGKEVLVECGFSSSINVKKQATNDTFSADKDVVLSVLATGFFSTEELIKVCGLQYTALISHLTELELSGKIKKQGSRWHLQM